MILLPSNFSEKISPYEGDGDIEYEKRWDKSDELRQDLNNTRSLFTDYTNTLVKIADVPPLISGRYVEPHLPLNIQ